jgi:hypothetical protein
MYSPAGSATLGHMGETVVEDWPLCVGEPGCRGVQVTPYDCCLAHLSAADRTEALKALGPGTDADFRGTSFSVELLGELLAALRDPQTARVRFGAVNFFGATFDGPAGFGGATFGGDAGFGGATFSELAAFFGATFDGPAGFGGATFDGDARFGGATFSEPAAFGGATFNGLAGFDSARFDGPAAFDSATFDGSAAFFDATFSGPAAFRRATFSEPADFGDATFDRLAGFGDATFDGPAAFDSATFSGDADFRRATFSGPAAFGDATFSGPAGFGDATFSGPAGFGDATFSGPAGFGGARFGGDAGFGGATFGGDAGFGGATFDGPAGFGGATFGGDADFRSATVSGPAEFRRATFSGPAAFGRATFTERAGFGDATFSGPAGFDGVRFSGEAQFPYARLGDGSRLGPCRARVLVLTRSRIGANVTVQCRTEEIDASDVDCPEGLSLQLDGGLYVDAARIHSPGRLTLRYADGELTLAGASFTSPTTIAAPDRTLTPPRLLGLSRVDATNLTLVGLDLGSCRLLDCYNRDQLRIDGPPRLAGPPPGRRWTGRQVLAEEHLWRARYDRRPGGWFPTACRHPGETAPDHTPLERTGTAARQQAARLQTAYRDLRKGREDAKDEPGSADLYYGEMELRRLAAPPRSIDRGLLTAYWAVAGYGLRAWRPLVTLLVTLALATVGFATVGFAAATRTEYRPTAPTRTGQPAVYRQVTVPTGHPGWDAALDHSIDSATSLLRPAQPVPLTFWGRVFEIALRLLGPVLLGLAVLAIRGRVKR